MKARLLLAGAALALTSTFAFAAPESLLPPVFDEPAPAQTPRPEAPAAPSPGGARAPSSGSSPVVQPLPGRTPQLGPVTSPVPLPANLPTLRELEAMDADEIDELLGLKP